MFVSCGHIGTDDGGAAVLGMFWDTRLVLEIRHFTFVRAVPHAVEKDHFFLRENHRLLDEIMITK